MRVVVDTNVVVSALLKPLSYPGQVIDAILSRTVTVLYDDRILFEYRDVLSRPKFRFSNAEVEFLLGFVEDFGEYYSGQRTDLVLPDVSDLPFLEVAIAGIADAIISVNRKDFMPRKGQHHIRVITPAEFAGLPN